MAFGRTFAASFTRTRLSPSPSPGLRFIASPLQWFYTRRRIIPEENSFCVRWLGQILCGDLSREEKRSAKRSKSLRRGAPRIVLQRFYWFGCDPVAFERTGT